MPGYPEIVLKKKQYNAATDNAEGIVVFDSVTKTMYVGGVRFGSNIKNVTWNSTTKDLTITTVDGGTSTINLKDDTSANAPTSLLARLRDDINANTSAIVTLNGTGNGSVSKSIGDALGNLDNTLIMVSTNNGVVTLKTTIIEEDGVIDNSNSGEVVLNKVATSGASDDVSVNYNSQTTDMQTAISDIDARVTSLDSGQIQYIEPTSNATTPSGYYHYYSGNNHYTGTLAASASTMNRIYLCKTTSDGDYHQIKTAQRGNTYTWIDISANSIDLSGYVKSVTQNGIIYTPNSGGDVSLPSVVNTISGETAISGGDGSFVSVSTSDSTSNGVKTTTIASQLKTKDVATSSSSNDGVATANDVKNYVQNNLTTIKTWTNSDIPNNGN